MKKGRVYLVGAGPGDYKLITLRGFEKLKNCDVIVYDRLSSPKLLEWAKDGCELIYVGKKAGNHTMKQQDINRLLAQKAMEGKDVVRLKGGDPYVFGRGGEEGEHLYNEGIPFEVIPGITSAIGGLCYGGIPVTNRGYNTSFHVITGHLKDEKEDLDFHSLAKLKGTLVFLMGMKNLEKICEKLVENGKKKDTPVAIVHWAAHSNQKVVTGNLSNIVEKVRSQKISSPSLIAVGEVVEMRKVLNFYENKPLFGKNIIITRPEHQNHTLADSILDLGGNPIAIPSIEIKDIYPNNQLMEAIESIERYSYIIFTSVNGVRVFFQGLVDQGYDLRKIGKTKVVAIGSATGDYLKEKGLIPDIMPKRYVAEEIYEELSQVLNKEDKILIPRSKDARPYLVEELQKLCDVEEIHLYYTKTAEKSKKLLKDAFIEQQIDYITFTSSSTVKGVIDLLGEEYRYLLKGVKTVSIGPITSKTMEKYDIELDLEADIYTAEGIIEEIITFEKEGSRT